MFWKQKSQSITCQYTEVAITCLKDTIDPMNTNASILCHLNRLQKGKAKDKMSSAFQASFARLSRVTHMAFVYQQINKNNDAIGIDHRLSNGKRKLLMRRVIRLDKHFSSQSSFFSESRRGAASLGSRLRGDGKHRT